MSQIHSQTATDSIVGIKANCKRAWTIVNSQAKQKSDLLDLLEQRVLSKRDDDSKQLYLQACETFSMDKCVATYEEPDNKILQSYCMDIKANGDWIVSITGKSRIRLHLAPHAADRVQNQLTRVGFERIVVYR
jgi:hypothetical protein